MTGSAGIEINLTAVIMAVEGDRPVIFALSPGKGMPASLPSGPFDPVNHRTLELGLRGFAADQAGLELGYVEQLYTFGDRGRHVPEGADARHEALPHVVSIGYLALTRIRQKAEAAASFRDLYRYFPWEDWRGGKPAVIDALLLPALHIWARAADDERQDERLAPARRGLSREERIALYFGNEDLPFDEEKVLERYELLYDAGLVAEALRDRRLGPQPDLLPLGESMVFDHRRILATALGRIRAKLKYRPVVFEMLPERFTLTELQRKVEAIAGHHLHKQNFRRLVETAGLVEPTGEQATTGGRPAATFRFRHDVLTERPAPGLRLGRPT